MAGLTLAIFIHDDQNKTREHLSMLAGSIWAAARLKPRAPSAIVLSCARDAYYCCAGAAVDVRSFSICGRFASACDHAFAARVRVA